MDLAELRTFVEIAKHQSFSGAAEAMFLTQPAVSKRVATLEDDIGTRLFDRIGRQITLTETGEVLLPRAMELLQQAEDLKRLVRNISGTVDGSLLLGTSHHIGLHRLPPVLKRYTSTYSQVKLDIRFLDSEAACRQVQKGDLELAIVTLPTIPFDNLEILQIWNDELVFVVNRRHPLAKIDNPSLQALAAYPAVLPGPTTFTRGILNRAMHHQGLELNVGMSTNYMETLKMLVQTGQGWSLLPKTMLDSSLLALPVKLQLFRQLGVVTHRQRTLSNAAQALLDMLPRLPDQ